jgi:predicted nucleic acid-binding protein
MVVSDTNILGSFAAADALPSLFAVLVTDSILIPPAVEAEIQMGVTHHVTHLQKLLDAIGGKHLVVTPLNAQTQAALASFPRQLNIGEREAIALALNTALYC